MTRVTPHDGLPIGSDHSRPETALPPETDTSGDMALELADAAVVLLGRTGGEGTVSLTGCSMLPTLEAGQRLAVEFSPERLRVGDLLLFRQKDYLVVHRLVARGRGSEGSCRLRTRGDGVLKLDPAMDRSSIRGRIVAVEDSGGRRDLRTGAARAYGRAVAWHDRFWAALGWLAYVADRLIARIGVQVRFRFRNLVGSLDRRLLRLAHGILFRRVHEAIPIDESSPSVDTAR